MGMLRTLYRVMVNKGDGHVKGSEQALAHREHPTEVRHDRCYHQERAFQLLFVFSGFRALERETEGANSS